MKQLKNMKETLVSATQAQLANLQNVDTKELGCAIDMIKDLSEAMYYCSIVKSMEEVQEEQKKQQQQPQQQQYQHQPSMMYFREMYPYPYPYYPERDQDREYNRMYYSEGGSTQTSNSSTGSSNRSGEGNGGYRNYKEFQYYPNPYEGRSPEQRRTYMESKHSGNKEGGMKELERYAQELTSDIIEMMQEATAEEKQMLARKLTVLSNKIQQA